MENKNIAKLTAKLFFIAIFLAFISNLVLFQHLKNNFTSNNYEVSKRQEEILFDEGTDEVPFFKFIFPVPYETRSMKFNVRPKFSEDLLSQLVFEFTDNNKKKRILLECNSITSFLPVSGSILQNKIIKEYRRSDYNTLKENVLNADLKDFSWWNLDNNFNLWMYLSIKENSSPAGLKGITILQFKEYTGFFEEYELTEGSIYYGYNFETDGMICNLIFYGYKAPAVLNLIRKIKLIKDTNTAEKEVLAMYNKSSAPLKKIYLLSAISLSQRNDILLAEWNKLAQDGE